MTFASTLTRATDLSLAGRVARVCGYTRRDAIREAKRIYLDASHSSGDGARSSTAVRWWVIYCVHVLGVNPIQPRHASDELRETYENLLEDCMVWLMIYQPSGRPVSAKTCGKYASTIRGWYKRHYRGVLGVGAAAARLNDVLKGAAREIPQPPPLERHGCTAAALRDGLARQYPLDAAGEAGTRHAMLHAALQTAFAGLMRGCELACDDAEAFSHTEHILPDDVTFFGEQGVHMRLQMRKRKDLRVLSGKQATVAIAGGGTILDAPAACRRWAAARGAAGLTRGHAFFCWPDGSPLRTRHVCAAVKACMAAVGLDPDRFGAHSLRIGGATAALAAGVSPQLIRLMGRWSSDVYEIYCRMSLESALRVGTAIASTDATTFEGGFQEERLEMLQQELDEFRASAVEGEEEDVER